MKNHLIPQVLILILFLTNSCLLSVSHAQSLPFLPETPGETFRNLISARSHLLLGSSNAIYRLDNSLVRQETKSLEAANRLLVTDYVGSFRDSVLSCSSDSCFLAQIIDFTNVTWEVDQPFISEQATDNVAAVFAPRANGTSDLTFGERANGRNPRLLAKGSLVNVGAPSQLFNRYARRPEGNRFDPLVYLTEFPLRYVANDSGYVYFVVRPSEEETRLVRFCEDDAGILGAFDSHFEIILKCGSHSATAPSTAATFIDVTSTAFDNRPTIVISTNRVLGMNSAQLEVCSFDVGYINFLMTQKYEDCINARDNAMAGFLRDGQTTCTRVDQPDLFSECPLPGIARPGLEVQNPFIQQPMATLPLGSAATTSIIHTTLDGALYLFTTTTNGSLHQFHIPNPTTANFVRTVQLPLDVASLENVTKMVASDDGDYIFAMTPSRLFRHSVDMCDTFTSCSECLTSGDPICGWCPLRGMCTRQTNCPSVAPVNSPIWINQVSSCPAIDVISPEIVYIPDLSSSTPSFSLTTSNIAGTPLSMYDYNCQFQFQDANGMVMIRDRTATAQSNIFTCTAPPREQLPQLADGQDTLETVISLTVRNNGDVSIASLDMFPFTDCAVHISCTSCIGASRCEWCPFSFQCIQPGTSCTTNELTITNGGVCPQIFPSSATGEYLVHSNYDYQETPLRINSSDLTKFRSDFDGGRFTCQICSQNDTSCSSPLFTSPASLAQSGNEILCQRTRFNSNDPTPAITAGIRVVWDNQRTVDNPENASVILYSCSLKGTNCGQCLAQESRFECSFCIEGPAPPVTPGNCQFEATCSTGNGFLRFNDPQDVINCPRPVITGFEPRAGPTSGGTMVTINGTDLGARREDIVNVMIDGVNCNVTGYTPGISLTCITDQKQGSVVSDKVFITFAHRQGERIQSEDDFEFVTPSLNWPPAIPAMGPRSGGTNITVVGGSIGTGSSHRVTIGQGNCTIINVSLNEIRCTTPPVGDGGEMNVVTVFVDNWMFGLSGFLYVDDPEFESITPSLVFIASGTTYTITGRNFDSVQEPRLLVYYDGAPIAIGNRRKRRQIMQEGARFVSEPCSVESSLTMQCTAPSLSINNGEFNQSSRLLRIGLLMDGVSSLLVVNETLELHLNPTFTQFGEERVFTIGVPIQLEIQGEGFYFTPRQVIVLVETCNSEQGCLCTVTNVFKSNDTLTCEIDFLTQQDLNRSGPLTITVAVGNLRQSVGMIRIEDVTPIALDITTTIITSIIVGGVLAVALFLILIICCVVCYHCRKVRVLEGELGWTNNINQMELSKLQAEHEKSLVSSTPRFNDDDLLKVIPENLLISSSQLKLFNKPIGQGESGVVYKAQLINWQGSELPRAVAVKTAKGLFQTSDIEGLISEMSKMKDFHHPNVMTLIGVCLDAGPGVSIVMPFMANGSLLEYLKKERDNLCLTETDEIDEVAPVRKLLLRMCFQVAKGMEYLSFKKFIHRDLAARNCMLDYSGNVKVGDFGLAEDVYTRGYFRQGKDDAVKLPFKWMAPESLRDGLFNEKSDVWSFGITCWEVFSAGSIPYSGVDAMSMLKILERGTRLEKPENIACAPEYYSMMMKCWALSPEDRPRFDKLSSSLEKLLSISAGYLELRMVLLPSEGEENQNGDA